MIYGTLHLSHDRWYIVGRAQMLRALKRQFDRHFSAGEVVLDASPENAELLHWFLQRYPLEMSTPDRAALESAAEARKLERAGIAEMLNDPTVGSALSLEMLLPLRDYQKTAVALLEKRRNLLLGDDLGLGKTAVGIGAHQHLLTTGKIARTVVVCQTHLQAQWRDQAHKFVFGVVPHIVKTVRNYALPEHDLLIVPYSKLSAWGDTIAQGGYGLVIYDEVQELRRGESLKYQSAKVVSAAADYVIGLSATPIYNYGDEIHHVLSIIEPGVLGGYEAFVREWCYNTGNHWVVRNPAEMNEYLALELGIFLRRRRTDVGRELPEVMRVTLPIDADPSKLAENKDHRTQLARSVLAADTRFVDKGQAARELDLEVRQSTGVAKALTVAEYVIERVLSGEKVVLCGWHRRVYEIWEAAFAQAHKRGYTSSGAPRPKAVFYTGTESPKQKTEAVDAFVSGDANIFVMSLRAGAGLDGLQTAASEIYFGELDWSPKVHDQCIGRLNRDGSIGGVTAVFLVCEIGSDPVMARVLGLKREQSDGIVDGISTEDEELLETKGVSRGRALAEATLNLN